MDRRNFIKRLGILIPATAALPGMLISDARHAIEVPVGMDKQLLQKYWTVDALGVFSNGKCLMTQPLKGGPACMLYGDTLFANWSAEFHF